MENREGISERLSSGGETNAVLVQLSTFLFQNLTAVVCANYGRPQRL